MDTLMYAAVLGAVTLFNTIIFLRKRVRPKISQPTQEDVEAVQRLFADRLIGDFVLTGAAVPHPRNPYIPVEGFRVFEMDSPHFRCRIVVSISAEKLLDFFIDALHLVGESVTFSVLDVTDEVNAKEHLTFYRDAFVIESILNEHRHFIMNNGDLQLSAFSEQMHLAVQLVRTRNVVIYTNDVENVAELLRYYEIDRNDQMRLFAEGDFCTRNLYRNTDMLEVFLDKIGIDESRTINMSEGQDTS